MFNDAFPILTTPDMPRALGFYRDLLGFDLEMHPAPGFAMLARGDLHLLLSAPSGEGGGGHLGIGLSPDAPAGAGGQRFALWVYADSCDEAIERLRGAGATVTEEPADQPWGERVARVLDPDGNEVIVGQKA